MLHGRILRKPNIHATLASVDLEPIRSMSGVVHVQHEGDVVGVIANDKHALSVAITKLDVDAVGRYRKRMNDRRRRWKFLIESTAKPAGNGHGAQALRWFAETLSRKPVS